MARSDLSFCKYLAPLRDPRRSHLRRGLPSDIIAIVLCAAIAGTHDWQQVVTFAHHRRARLQTFLALLNGIPSHDTLARVFERLGPQAFQACFSRWLQALAQTLGLKHIAIDGKPLRYSGRAARARTSARVWTGPRRSGAGWRIPSRRARSSSCMIT